MIRRWRRSVRSRLHVVHLVIPGMRITSRGLVRSHTRRIVVIERGDLFRAPTQAPMPAKPKKGNR